MVDAGFERSSGVLLHVTSLPGPYGIGDLGPAARRWIDWLAMSGSRYWQVLPLGPTGLGDSPYSSFSSKAGNIDLISPESLVAEGLLDSAALSPLGDEHRVVYPVVHAAKRAMIEKAFKGAGGTLLEEFVAFRRAEADWLEPYSLFMALRDSHGEGSWTDWPEDLRFRDPDALARAIETHSSEIDHHAFGQFLFHTQFESMRSHARSRGIEIIGDVPLYVAPDSVDVWLDTQLFQLDESGEPCLVAGVPPDMFSADGQRWGNPLYRWEAHAKDGYAWWADRLRGFLRRADVLRIDHFTGFATFWEIEASKVSAVGGRWRKGPGASFFRQIEQTLGPLPVIVEDLGPGGQEVEDLRIELGYPGMSLLQELFMEDGPYPASGEDCVVYTGTHDNDTALGRLESETEDYRRRALDYTGSTEESYPWGLIEAAWSSPGVIAIAPMQDLLGLGTEARMNRPSTTSGNWQWRVPADSVNTRLSSMLSKLNDRTGRRA